MSKVLSIPFHINALLLSDDVDAAPASADFSEVPYIDANGLSNYPETPFISENLVSHPFDTGHKLKKGIHLHFDIPIGFKTTQKLKGKTQESYPPLPNRWLVIKNNTEKWIIESDYLWAESDTSSEKLEAINVLLPKYKSIDKDGNLVENTEMYSRCRFVGRKYNAADYPKNDGGKYWRDYFNGQGITAIGYGEPTFAGFYPNCKSIFGFHDENGKSSDKYEVFGWYANNEDLETIIKSFSENKELESYSIKNEDTLKTIENLGERWENLTGDEAETFRRKYEKYIFLYENDIRNLSLSAAQELEIRYNKVKAFENAYEVNYATNDTNLILPEQLLFFGKIEITESGQTQSSGHSIDDANIAIGNTGREALNALKAQQLYDDDDEPKKKTKAQIENDLEVIHCDTILDKEADLTFKFFEERHQKTFSHIEGGKFWFLDIKLNTSDGLTAENEQSAALNNLLKESGIQTLHQALLNRISDLNALRIDYNKKLSSITSQQHQLFADWYKYMLTAHPPIYDADNYIKADDVMRFLNRFVIKNIYDNIVETDIIDSNQRKTIDNVGLNQDLDKTSLEQLKNLKDDDSILGKIINILFKEVDVKTVETNTQLLKTKDFFNKVAVQFTQLKYWFSKRNKLIHKLENIENAPSLLDDEVIGDNAIIDKLKTRKSVTSIVLNWQTLYDKNSTFSGLKTFFSEYEKDIPTDVSNDIQKILEELRLKLKSIEKQYDDSLDSYQNIMILDRLELNKLLQVIIQLTNNILIRNKANLYLNQPDDSKIEETKTFISTNFETVFIKNVESVIALYSDPKLIEAIKKAIIEEKIYLTNYSAKFRELSKEIDKTGQLLTAEIDENAIAYSQIIALLNALNTEFTEANIEVVQSKLASLQMTIKAIKKVDERSILQLLEEFETVMKETIATLEVEKQSNEGEIIATKKYDVLTGKEINIRLVQQTEPRYYEAKEPVVLIEATGLKSQLPTDTEKEITYEQQVLIDLPSSDFSTNLLDIENFKSTSTYTTLKYLTLNMPFWNPTIMDWEVSYLAIDDPSIQQKYKQNFITENFVLNDDQLELQIEKDKDLSQILNQNTGRIYKGSTILSPHAANLVNRKLEIFSKEEEIPKAFFSSQSNLSKITNLLADITETPIFKGSLTANNLTALEQKMAHSDQVRAIAMNPKLALTKEAKIIEVQNELKKQKNQDWQSSINRALNTLNNKPMLGSRHVGTEDKKTILSQSLGGFNQCLLMRKQTMQLEIDDPIALKDYKPLIKTIRDFIGQATRSAPEPKNYFNPIRSGVLRLKQLRIVDSFGQVAKVDFEETQVGRDSKIVVAETLIANKENQKVKVTRNGYDAFLPARLVQPMRLDLRWLSNQDDTTASESIQNSPICGWIVPNFLNETIALFTHQGELLGDVALVRDANDVAAVRLLPKPGAHSFYEFEIQNEHLRNLVVYFIEKGAKWFYSFLKNINETMVYADPEGFERHTEISMLVGKPLALVRGRIGFQAMEDYAINQDWSVFEKDVRTAFSTNYKRSTYDFEHVKLPVKLGHVEQLNDGLFGFWVEEEETFHPVLKTENMGDIKILEKSIDEPSTLLTMLFDPRGQLNAFSGILPTKTITIPPEMFAEALKKMKIYFSVGPFITPKSKLQFPIPRSKVYEWKWVYETNHNLTEISTKPTIEKSIFQSVWNDSFNAASEEAWKTLLDNNWLKSIENDVTQAYVNFDEKTRQALPKIENIADDWAEKADQILNENYRGIAQTTADVAFGQFELREGWLKLMNEL